MEQFKVLFVLMLFYGSMALYYNFRALTVKPAATNQKQRFSQYASGLVLIVSGMSAAVLVFPAESQTLQFMNECGVVNIYMIMMSYLFAPYNEEDGGALDFNEAAIRRSSNGSEKELVEMDAPNH